MAIKPDNIQFLSTLPNYINIDNSSQDISISGVLLPLAVNNYTVTFTTSRNNTRFDIYGKNQNTLTKQLFSNTPFPVVYQNSSGEIARIITTYASTSITVTIQLTNNTAGVIGLISQIITISLVQYQIPY